MFGLRKTTERVALSLGALGAAASMAGSGTFATFTGSASGGPEQITSASVTLNLGATGASANRFNVSASGVAAGDMIQRSADLIGAQRAATNPKCCPFS